MTRYGHATVTRRHWRRLPIGRLEPEVQVEFRILVTVQAFRVKLQALPRRPGTGV